MAGIGFELNRLVNRKNFFGKIGGYFFATASCLGSMIMGFLLLFLIQLISNSLGNKIQECTLFTSYMTNTVFISMIIFSIFSLVLSRYLSDMIYVKKEDHILPSFWGSTTIIIPVAILLYLPILIISKVESTYTILLLILLSEFVCSWIATMYVTILKYYKKITLAYAIGTFCSIVLLFGCYIFKYMNIEMMLFSVIISYGIVLIMLIQILNKQFEKNSNYIFEFLKWFIKYPSLSVTGFCTTLGTIIHFYIIWFSKYGVTLQGLIRNLPMYDFPAIIAYLSTIITTITFVAVLEPNFYKKYAEYFRLLNSFGNYEDLSKAKSEMVITLKDELKNLILKQLACALIFVVIISQVLLELNIGMNTAMIEIFKLLCIGYSLYAIGNVILQLQLYFSDNKGAEVTAIIFLVFTIIGTFFSLNLKQAFWGVGLIISSITMIIVGNYRLEKYIDDLEYNVLNHKNIENNEIIDLIGRKMKNIISKISQNKIANKFVNISIILILVFTLIFSIDIKTSIKETFYPQKTDTILNNPGVGLAPWAINEGTKEMGTTLVYVDLSWADWEPTEGNFDYETFEEKNHLQEYRNLGKQVVFRFYMDYPSNEEHMDIPNWLYKKINEDGNYYDNSYGKGFSPNYANTTLIEYHEKAVKALGERYGNDDMFLYIELGSIGHWGEWHTNYGEGVERIPDYSIRIEYIEAYIDAFRNSIFLMRYPVTESEKYNAGIYNDMVGDKESTNYWLKQLEGGIWDQTNKEELINRSDAWKTVPIGGEFASSNTNEELINENLENTISMIKESHQSFIGPKIIIDEDNKENYTKQMNEILKVLGHRIYVEKCTINITRDDKLEVLLELGNDGIAPMYTNAKLALYIYDENGDKVQEEIINEFDTSSIFPEEIQEVKTTLDIQKIQKKGGYTLCIGFVNVNNEPIIELAMERYDGNIFKIGDFSR